MSKPSNKRQGRETLNQGFIKLVRGDKAREIMQYPHAWTLLSIIGYRARRSNTTLNPHSLQLGEALVGDYANYGMTERTYRTSKEQLAKWNLATFKATNKGTIARLLDSSIYDINIDVGDEQSDRQATGKRRTADEQSDRQATTNEEGKKERRKEGKAPPAPLPALGQASAGLQKKDDEESGPILTGKERVMAIARCKAALRRGKIKTEPDIR